MFYYIKYYYKSLKNYYFPKKKREQPESKVISKPELSQKQKEQLSKLFVLRSLNIICLNV